MMFGKNDGGSDPNYDIGMRDPRKQKWNKGLSDTRKGNLK